MVLLDVALGESLHPAVHALPRLLWLPFEVHRLDLKRNAKSGFLIEIATQHLIDFGELKERPIMLSPGRRELAADTRSASTLSQSKACSRAEENQFGRIFLVVASYINICSAGAMTSLLCVLLRMCSPGQEFSP